MEVETVHRGLVSRQVAGRLVVETKGVGFVEITAPVSSWVTQSGITHGLLAVFCRHTSASLTLQENADRDVRTDLLTALDRFAPRDVRYVHNSEGPDDMPAHIRAMLTDVSLVLPVRDGRLALGTWQGLYLIEHRDKPHRREVLAQLVGN